MPEDARIPVARGGARFAAKAAVVAVLAIMVVGAIIAKERRNARAQETREAERTVATVEPDTPAPAPAPSPAPAPAKALPRLVDLGAGKCIPCKMMAPILEELKKEYAGRFDVVFIDVWEDPEAGKPFGIRLIPTQVFYDASGKEVFRHEGFFSKADILAKWKELGVDF